MITIVAKICTSSQIKITKIIITIMEIRMEIIGIIVIVLLVVVIIIIIIKAIIEGLLDIKEKTVKIIS